MQIFGTSQVLGTQPVDQVHHAHSVGAAEDVHGLHGADQIDISSEAAMIGRIQDVGDVGLDRIAQIRQQIAEGTYATQEKLEFAVGRLLDDILGG